VAENKFGRVSYTEAIEILIKAVSEVGPLYKLNTLDP
jgi:hypothetical protein